MMRRECRCGRVYYEDLTHCPSCDQPSVLNPLSSKEPTFVPDDPVDEPFTKGHQYAPPGDPLTVFACGPSTGTCKCECASGGPCEHVWDGPEKTDGNLSTATCSRCGMPAIEHDMWVMP